MLSKALVLSQFRISGGFITSYQQQHDSDVTGVYNSLANLYTVVVTMREGAKLTPFGGFIVKTDIPSDSTILQKNMYEIAQELSEVKPLLQFGNSLQIVPTNYLNTTLPSEADIEQIAVGACMSFGWVQA